MPESVDVEMPTSPRHPGRLVSLLRRVAPLLVVAAVVIPVNLLHVARIRTISPLDELMHIDYLIRASAPGFQRMSDVFSQESMDEIACRGHPVDRLPPCGERPYVPKDFSWKGRNLASGHSPWYYLVTGVAARPLRALLPGDSLVTWGRALGSAWLFAGLALIMAAARRLRVPPWAVAPATVLLALSPSTQHAATTINPDATAVFAGGLVLLATVRVTQRSAHPLWCLAAAGVALLLDPGNLLIVLAAALFVLTMRTLNLSLRLLAGVALFTGAAAAEVANRALVRLLGVVDYSGNPKDILFAVDSLNGPMVWGEKALLTMVPPTKGYVFPELSTPAHDVAASAAVLLAVAGLIACAVGGPKAFGADRLAACGLATLVLGAPLLVLMRYARGSSYFPIPSRYGLSVLPVLVLAVATTLAVHCGGRVLTWAVTLALAATTVAALA